MPTAVKKKKRPSPQSTKKSKRKKRRSKPPSVAEAAQQVDELTPAQRIRDVSRGFRLSFGGLPTQRKLSDKQRKLINKEDVAKKAEATRMLTQSQKLFDKHPATTQLNSAKGAVEALFHSKTLPWPEPGVRILILKTDHIDFDNMSVEEIEKDYARQIEEFSKEILDAITEYDAAVRNLQSKWHEVVNTAREALEKVQKGLFDPDNYADADQLPGILYRVFRPVSIEPPKEYAHIDPVERQRVIQMVEAQFKEACEKQADFVVTLLHDAIDQMIQSVQGFHDRKQKRFANSVVDNVFKAFEEFKEKTIKYGILKGTALEAEFNRAMAFMTEGALDANTMPGALRQSPAKRVDLIDKMDVVKQSLSALAEKRKRRSVMRD